MLGFYFENSIRITYWQANGKKYISGDANAPDSPFCCLIKSNPALCAQCDACDKKAIAIARVERELYAYKCHIGLEEYVYPVLLEEKLLGFLMIGQVRKEEENTEQIMNKLNSLSIYGIDSRQLFSYYQLLPVISKEKMLAVTRMLKAIACYTYLSGYIRFVTPSIVSRTEEYIRKHLSEHIALDDISRALFISKSKLCHTVRAELNMSVIQLINTRRIANVKEMLLNGESLARAAEASGFSDSSYCSNVFKRMEGISPMDFLKKEHRE